MNLTIDYLRVNHQMIHYFGLGFIQLKLTDQERLHFYTHKLPAIVAEEDIHNHRYTFTSRILAGELTQELFELWEEGYGYLMEDESCREGATPGHPAEVAVHPVYTGVYGPGSSYTIKPNTFHRISAKDNTITHLTRGPHVKEYAQVIRLRDSEKVCPFSKKVSEAELWEIVDGMLGLTSHE